MTKPENRTAGRGLGAWLRAPRPVLYRSVAAMFGGYVFASLGAAVVAMLGIGPGAATADALLGGALCGLAIYAIVIVYLFARRGGPVAGGLRPRMAWLHTWGGLWVCWLAYAIFLTGTLSVFTDPISHWMRPEQPPEPVAPPFVAANGHEQQINHGLRYLREHAAGSKMWELWPRDGEEDFQVFWINDQGYYDGAHLMSGSGEPEPPHEEKVRDTSGGSHFIEFHHALHAGRIGMWLVGAASVAMLVALISGVITHKRIFKDFFTFRPGKGQRSWLDAHNLLGVLTLPFLFVIIYSGIAISWATYMPAVLWAEEWRTGEPPKVLEYGPDTKPSGHPAELAPLSDMVRRGEALLRRPTYAVVVNHPGDSAMTVQVYCDTSPETQQGKLLSTRGVVKFDGVSGAVLNVQPSHAVPGHAARATMRTLDELHRLHFAGYAIRWLYFLSGLAGTAMMATGAILFMVKRRQKSLNEFGAQTPRVYRLIEVLNVAAVAGLALACIGYLWANRLLPLKLDQRHEWEVAAYFGIWLTALVHAALRPSAAAWREQLWTTATLCLLLPALNLLSTGENAAHYALRGDYERASVELTSVVLGALLACAAFKLQRRRLRTALPVHRKVAA